MSSTQTSNAAAPDQDIGPQLGEAVIRAREAGQALRIVGGDSKSTLGRPVDAAPLEVGAHRGIISFEPTELVLTARAGTPLANVERALDSAGQLLPFEPPAFGTTDTFGGVIACGLSGPRRPFAGSARDMVLGTRIVSGKGETLRFGGEVMKNVAGYDVSRLMVGAQGTLGVLLDISVKVLPKPAAQTTLTFEVDAVAALHMMDEMSTAPLPFSAMAHDGEHLRVRLAGTSSGVKSAMSNLGGDLDEDAEQWWRQLRDHKLDFFSGDAPLWRISVPPVSPPLSLNGNWLLDWAGTQRWLRTRSSAEVIRDAVAAVGGHATCYSGHADMAFHPLASGIAGIHQRLKNAFDPDRILNPGRLYPDI
jgi:glycolate oxidase FAD binding subunit